MLWASGASSFESFGVGVGDRALSTALDPSSPPSCRNTPCRARRTTFWTRRRCDRASPRPSRQGLLVQHVGPDHAELVHGLVQRAGPGPTNTPGSCNELGSYNTSGPTTQVHTRARTTCWARPTLRARPRLSRAWVLTTLGLYPRSYNVLGLANTLGSYNVSGLTMLGSYPRSSNVLGPANTLCPTRCTRAHTMSWACTTCRARRRWARTRARTTRWARPRLSRAWARTTCRSQGRWARTRGHTLRWAQPEPGHVPPVYPIFTVTQLEAPNTRQRHVHLVDCCILGVRSPDDCHFILQTLCLR